MRLVTRRPLQQDVSLRMEINLHACRQVGREIHKRTTSNRHNRHQEKTSIDTDPNEEFDTNNMLLSALLEAVH